MDLFIPKYGNNCREKINDVKDMLESQNLSSSLVTCSMMDIAGCGPLWQDLHDRANPVSVYMRSMSCDLDWPNVTVTKEELEFPLAYFISAYTDSRNIELQLSTIFRPHNSYCYHVDTKADNIFKVTLENIIKCYKHKYQDSYIAVSSRSVPVYWGHFSIVEAELICLQDLLNNGRRWEYATNLAGSEMVLFSNEELVRNLSSTTKPEIYVETCYIGESMRTLHKWGFNGSAHYDPENGGKEL